jgi:hypothetical protein
VHKTEQGVERRAQRCKSSAPNRLERSGELAPGFVLGFASGDTNLTVKNKPVASKELTRLFAKVRLRKRRVVHENSAL